MDTGSGIKGPRDLEAGAWLTILWAKGHPCEKWKKGRAREEDGRRSNAVVSIVSTHARKSAQLNERRACAKFRIMTTTQQATVEVFWKAFRGLSRPERTAFVGHLLKDEEYSEDLYDLALIESRRQEPGRPLRAYLKDRARRSVV